MVNEKTVRVIRSAGRWDFGPCDQCGKQCNEHFIHFERKVIMLPIEKYEILDPNAVGRYGHRECLIKNFGDAIEQKDLPMRGKNLLPPVA